MKRYRRAARKAGLTLVFLMGITAAVAAVVLAGTWLVSAGYGWLIIPGGVVLAWLFASGAVFFEELKAESE